MNLTPQHFHDKFHAIRHELGKVVIGQERVIENLLAAVFANGHVLLKGPPGLGRTLLVKTLAEVLGLSFRRIQFSPDLLPTDILGTEVLESNVSTGERNFRFFKGPVFANLILADEINRSPTRTQAALLEIMQERQVTSVGKTYFLPKPFVLIATQNTLETEGIWNLSEAQTDRFIMMIEQIYPTEQEERLMLHATTGSRQVSVESVTNPEEIAAMQALARAVPVVPAVRDFALAIVRASRPGEEGAAAEVNENIRLGASPRAAQALLLSSKVLALARGRQFVIRQDIIDVAEPVMSHRLLMDLRAFAGGKNQRLVTKALVASAKEGTLAGRSRWTKELLKV
ncbi:MAG: MoxR family ATPase [Planctomycetota bacterium]|nr:MoxR family ATPase [Planctomycetota bacterium]MDA1138586.1 MoxR family ATPase [Planctomycetota bacterium]